MKIKYTIQEIEKDELVDLLSTAASGSLWLGLNYDSIEYEQLPNKSEDDCIEDKMAKLLLAGKSIELFDRYAEDENDYYGTLPHKYDSDGDMRYTITLEDVKRGMQKAFDDCNFSAECMCEFVFNNNSFDQPAAETICQYIMFGEYIYY